MRDFESIAVTQEDGVTELRLHTDGGPMVFGEPSHREIGYALNELRDDRDTKVVIVTGTGDLFCTEINYADFEDQSGWEIVWWEGKRIVKGLMDLEVPVIGVVNGPAFIHSEMVLLNDICIASEKAVFQDKPHFMTGMVPGDGVHMIYPHLLGPRRGKYFLLTGEKIGAEEALQLGLVNEVVPHDQALPRAWELARQLASKPAPLLRYTREALNVIEREKMASALSHGLALEGAATYESPPSEVEAQFS